MRFLIRVMKTFNSHFVDFWNYLLSDFRSLGYGLMELCGLWKNLDQGLKKDTVFLYNCQFGVICKSAELLVSLLMK